MARRPKTIKNILAQRDRALSSIREENASSVTGQPRNIYIQGQKRAYWNQSAIGSDKRYKADTPVVFAARKYNKRVRQINHAADFEIGKLQKKGRESRAARKARGLSVG